VQERLLRINQEVEEEEVRQREEAMYKKQRIDFAEQRRNAPVNDSEMVDEMFGFMDPGSGIDDGLGPSAFQVNCMSFADLSLHLVNVQRVF